MDSGWTKRWRKRWTKGYHQNFLLWILMDYFIDFAAYEPKDMYFKGHGVVHLERGEWAFTQRELAKFFNVGRQQIRAQLELLKNTDFLTQDTTQSKTQHITKIRINKYDTYQSSDICEQPNQQPREQPCLNPTPTQLDDSTIYTKNKRNKEYMVAKRRHQLPDDFIITDSLKQYATQNGIDESRIDSVFSHFCDHHRAKGTVMLDWDAAWRTWVRNDRKFSKTNNTELEQDAWMRKHGLKP